VHAAGGAVAGGAAEGEDAAVAGDQPVAVARGGRRHADDRLVERLASGHRQSIGAGRDQSGESARRAGCAGGFGLLPSAPGDGGGMLVIRRRAGESILINGDIEIEVLEVGLSQVKLGISAPKDIPIVRKEVHVTGQQNRAASREISLIELSSLADKLHR